MRGKISEDKIMIGISAMKQIMSVFLGPFLTAYFIKSSTDTIIDISMYHIFCYILLASLSFIIMKIIKKKFRIGMFRVGVIVNFIYIMTIIILNSSIIKYLWLVAILSGIASSTYWMPYNLFSANKVSIEDRSKYTVKSKTVSYTISVICPVILGAYITITNYELTAMIILFVSLAQIILSFYLSKDEDKTLEEYNIKKALNKMVKNATIRKMLLSEFFIGMNVSDGALGVLITILIFNSFKTNMNLGIITSITTVLSIIAIKLYIKFFKNKYDKNIIIISSIFPIFALLTLLFVKNNITIIVYNIIYSTFTALLALIREIKLFNISNSEIDKNYQCEFFAVRESILNYGRLISYSILLFAGVINTEFALNITFILLTLSILMTGLTLIKVKD